MRETRDRDRERERRDADRDMARPAHRQPEQTEHTD